MRLLKKLTVVLMLVLLLTFVAGVASIAFAGDTPSGAPMFGSSCGSSAPVGMDAAYVWLIMCVIGYY